MNLPHTEAALALFDANAAGIDERFDAELEAGGGDARVVAWQAELAEAEKAVREAFFVDCQEQGIPNSHDHCMIVSLRTLREWAIREIVGPEGFEPSTGAL